MQLLSKVFSVKMVYRQLITIILSIYKNFSLGLVVISLYSFVFFGNLFANGTSELPTLINPCPASTFVIYESWRSEMLRSFASSILSVDA